MGFLKTILQRAYCTALIKPPVKVFGIAGRYASALYSAGHKKNKLDDVEKELTGFLKTMATDEALREFIENPTI